jgi:hypothetical protein
MDFMIEFISNIESRAFTCIPIEVWSEFNYKNKRRENKGFQLFSPKIYLIFLIFVDL